MNFFDHFRGEGKKARRPQRLYAKHSLLLALEPRQVFDAAMGAALAEVLPEPTDAEQTGGFQPETDSGLSSENDRLAELLGHSSTPQVEGGSASSDPVDTQGQADAQGAESKPSDSPILQALGDPVITPFAENTGNAPLLACLDQYTIEEDALLTLDCIEILDDTTTPLKLELRIASGGQGSFTLNGEAVAGSGVLSEGNKVLTITGDDANDVMAKLAKWNYFMGADQSGSASILYTLTEDVADPHNPVANFFTITVTPVNDPPTLTLKEFSTEEVYTAGATREIFDWIKVTEPENDTILLTISAYKEGTQTLAGGAFSYSDFGNTSVTITDTGDGRLSFRGSVSSISAMLGTLKYLTPESPGRIDFTVDVTDFPPVGESLSSSDTITFLVNDAPSIAIKPDYQPTALENSAMITNENLTKILFGGITLADNNENHGDTFSLTLTVNDPGPEIGALHCTLSQGTVPYTLDGTTLSATGLTLAQVRQILADTYFQGIQNDNKFGDFITSITLTDSYGQTATVDIAMSISMVNDSPVVAPPSTPPDSVIPYAPESPETPLEYLAVLEGGSGVFRPEQFGITDPDTPMDQIIITIDSLGVYGSLYKNGILQGKSASFTLADVAAGRISYTHGTQEVKEVPATGLIDTFTFRVNDGTGQSEAHSFFIYLNPKNDGFSVNASSGGNPVLWVWERQTGAHLFYGAEGVDKSKYVNAENGISISSIDDNLDSIQVTIKAADVPSAEYGRLYLKTPGGDIDFVHSDDPDTPDYVFQASDLKYLCYDATDKEPTAEGVPLKMTFADRSPAGGINRPEWLNTAADGVNTVERTFTIMVAPNNDDPYMEKNEGLGTVDDRAIISYPNPAEESGIPVGSTYLPITSAMLEIGDEDAANTPSTLTYTLTSLPQYGELLYKNSSGSYMRLAVGNSFSQADIDAGKIFFHYLGNGDAQAIVDPETNVTYYNLDTSFTFTVEDSSISAWPNTGKPGGIYDADNTPGTEDSYGAGNGSEHNYGNPNHDSDPDNDPATLQNITFHMYMRSYHDGEGETVAADPNVAPTVQWNTNTPIFEFHLDDTQISNTTHILNFADMNGDGIQGDYAFTVTNIDAHETDADIVFSLRSDPRGGVLKLGETTLVVGSSFTLADIKAGRVTYVHSGDEVFQESLSFEVSDGMNKVSVTNCIVNINPYNDRPTLSVNGDRTYVDEGGILYFTAGEVAFGQADFNGIFGFQDADGQRLHDPLNLAQKDVLTFTLGGPLPQHGDLMIVISGVATKIVETIDTGDSSPQILRSAVVLTIADLTPDGNGKTNFYYEHYGEEQFSDSFTIVARDNSLLANGNTPKESAECPVNIKVRSINDIPELVTNTGITASDSIFENNDGSYSFEVVLNSTHLSISDADFGATLSDADKKQLKYIIVDSCVSGTLYLKNETTNTWEPVGANSTFTQYDVDKGLVKYVNTGKNQHIDKFTFMVTDGAAYADNGAVKDFNISVQPINQAPEFSESTMTVWYEKTYGGVFITDESAVDGKKYIQISDPDIDEATPGRTIAHDIMQLTIDATIEGSHKGELSVDGSVLSAEALAACSIRYGDSGANKSVLIIEGSLEHINRLLTTLKYLTDDVPNNDDKTAILNLTINDMNNGCGMDSHNTVTHTVDSEKALTDTLQVIIHISPINDAPEASSTSVYRNTTVAEDTASVIFTHNSSSTTLSYLVIEDPDAFETLNNTFTIWADNGTFSFNGTPPANLMYQTQTISGKTCLVLTGSRDAINAALPQIRYTGKTDFNGADTVYLEYNDHGNTGMESGNVPIPKAYTHNFAITVSPVNDTPTIALKDTDALAKQVAHNTLVPTIEIKDPTTATNGVDIRQYINVADAKDYAFSHGDYHNADGTAVTLTISAASLYGKAGNQGTFTAANAGGVTVGGNGTGAITFTGTMTALRAYLADAGNTIVFKPTANTAAEPIDLTITINDLGNGSGNSADARTATTYLLVTVDVINDAPEITGSPVTIYEDLYGESSASYLLFNQGKFFVSDADAFAFPIQFTISIPSDVGKLVYNGVEYTSLSHSDLGEKTVSQINAILQQIRFKPAANYNGDFNLTITVNDKGHTGTSGGEHLVNGGLQTTETFLVTVRPVNDAPTVDAGKTAALASVNEDITDTSNTGNTVGNVLSALVTSFFKDANDTGDQKGTFAGVLITGNAATAAQGTWQYYSGSEWKNIVVSGTSALYLDKDTLIRFKPAANYFGDPGRLTMHLVEDMPVSAPYKTAPVFATGSLYNIGTVFGTGAVDVHDKTGVDLTLRPYTANTVTIGTSVLAVNDAPVLTVPSPLTVAEDGRLEITGISFTDADMIYAADTTNASKTFTLTLKLPSSDLGSLSVAAYTGLTIASNNSAEVTLSGTYTVLRSFLTSNDTNKHITYSPPANFHHAASDSFNLTVTVSDNGNIHSSGATALTDSETVAISVTPVNDRPVVTTSTDTYGWTILEDTTGDATYDRVSRTVSDLLGEDILASRFSDPNDTGRPNGADALAGIMISAADAQSLGNWQYSTDGVNWTSITGITANNMLFLGLDTHVRFAPAKNLFTGNSNKPSLTFHLVETDTNNDSNVAGYTIGSTGHTSAIITATGRVSSETLGLALSITNLNSDPDTPVLTAITCYEDTDYALTGISISDPDGDQEIVDLTLTVTNGTLAWADATGVAVQSLSTDKMTLVLKGTVADIQDAIDAGKLVYTAKTDYYGSGTLTVKIQDYGTADPTESTAPPTNAPSATSAVAITVKPVNDAPEILENKDSVDFGSQDEDTLEADLPAKTVETLFGPSFTDARDQAQNDPGNNFLGVFVVGIESTTGGAWQYKNASNNWVDISASCSDATALYLGKDTEIRFKSSADYNGSAPKLEVRLVEETVTVTGEETELPSPLTAGDTTNITSRMGETAYPTNGHISAGKVTLTATVTPVDDAPEINISTAPFAVAGDEDTVIPFGLPAITLTDVDNDTLTVVVKVTHGTLALVDSSFAGVTITGQNTETLVFTGKAAALQTALNTAQFNFTPDRDYNGTAALSLSLTDQIATLDHSFGPAITVNPVNDRPVLSGGITLPAIPEGSTQPVGGTVAQLIGPSFNDNRDNSNASSANTMIGVVVTGNQAGKDQGAWEYQDSSGDWVPIGWDFSAGGLYLEAGTELRFAPAPGLNTVPGGLVVYAVEDSTLVAAPTLGDIIDKATLGTTASADTVVVQPGFIPKFVDPPPNLLSEVPNREETRELDLGGDYSPPVRLGLDSPSQISSFNIEGGYFVELYVLNAANTSASYTDAQVHSRLSSITGANRGPGSFGASTALPAPQENSSPEAQPGSQPNPVESALPPSSFQDGSTGQDGITGQDGNTTGQDGSAGQYGSTGQDGAALLRGNAGPGEGVGIPNAEFGPDGIPNTGDEPGTQSKKLEEDEFGEEEFTLPGTAKAPAKVAAPDAESGQPAPSGNKAEGQSAAPSTDTADESDDSENEVQESDDSAKPGQVLLLPEDGEAFLAAAALSFGAIVSETQGGQHNADRLWKNDLNNKMLCCAPALLIAEARQLVHTLSNTW